MANPSLSGILKRKFEFVDEDPWYSSSSSSLCSSTCLGRESYEMCLCSDPLEPGPTNCTLTLKPRPVTSILKKTKGMRANGKVHFGTVTVFLFPRCQGFTSVPSRGGCTLGMTWRHADCRKFTVAEHAVDQQCQRREKLQQRWREERLKALKQRWSSSGDMTLEEMNSLIADNMVNEDVQFSTEDLEGRGFPQSYSSKRRRALLRAAGVAHIDREEKRELKRLRLSREDCGCHCQDYCDPETCACSLSGIKCQMDRSNFPCGCSKDGCGNPRGRIEFNSSRVQSHYIRTQMKLELERRLMEEKADQPYRLWSSEQGPSGGGNHSLLPVDDTISLSLPASPALCLSTGLSIEGEDSCSSDMSDSSFSSVQSLDYDAEDGSFPDQHALDMADRSIPHTVGHLHTGTQDLPHTNKTHTNSVQQSFSQNSNFSEADSCTISGAGHHERTLLNLDNTDNLNSNSNYKSLTFEYLDENANQSSDLLLNNSFDAPPTPSPYTDSPDSYMDLSLSSESDLGFFDGFYMYSTCPVQSHLKIDSQPDNICLYQFSRCSSPPQADEPGVSYLESLIGLS
ncbi:cysteine/serine-rich nuclear protein 1 [Chanos chanos]|uniref:Cysteine/serine-rich nuclear protein 1 n=1 Tax=Chanos chanos TaxID=29144 RepID=A0A6J2VEK5_CHACN|nr:cysteine/serine-rich nuclear protein 1-like [Chanos chanos]